MLLVTGRRVAHERMIWFLDYLLGNFAGESEKKTNHHFFSLATGHRRKCISLMWSPRQHVSLTRFAHSFGVSSAPWARRESSGATCGLVGLDVPFFACLEQEQTGR